MCTLAIYFHTSPDFPVVVAANRDEFYDRPATPPTRLVDDPWIVAGHDVRAGGTWLGVNAHDVVAGILNRRTSRPPDPDRRSRGLLCLEALQEPSVVAACARVLRDPGNLYNPFNLLIASTDASCVIGNSSGAMVQTTLEPGLHLLTNLELNDPECPRIAKSYGLFDALRSALAYDTLDRFLRGLRTILSDHSTPLDPRADGPPNNLCVHTERFGTRSSSVLLYSAREGRFRMWHAAGAPCQTGYVEIALPAPAT
ncbi:MAG: NRDE family protein [Candidatus Binatia bacterium]